MAPYLKLHGRDAIQSRYGPLFFGTILRATDVAYTNGRAIDRSDDKIVECLGIGNAPHGAQYFFAGLAGDVAAWNVGVLAPDGVPYRGYRQLVGSQPIGV